MQKVTQIMDKMDLKKNQIAKNRGTSCSPQLEQKLRGATVLTALKAIYPTKFQSLYPTEEAQKIAIKLWNYHLNEFSDEIVTKAILDCPDKFGWVPDLAEFKNLCKTYKNMDNSPFAMGLVSSTLHEAEYLKKKSMGEN